ncbi:MAG: OmpA family protein [Deltaproteobacteria bacterium]|nr:OmpA family protein [Deltaproteobacteria bacterium]
MAKKKRHHEEEPENMERWLVSYADFITLLFAFFVTMYAISRVDEAKMGSAVESLQRALGSIVAVQITHKDAGVFDFKKSPLEQEVSEAVNVKRDNADTVETEQFEKMAGELHKEVQKILETTSGKGAGAQANQIKYLIDKRGLVVRVPENFFFQSGQASIRSEFYPVLDALGHSLEKIPNQIRIEGHTDSVPINTLFFPSNWELSTARATTIVRYLLASVAIKPNKISATGYAEFRPIAPNNTAEGKMQNRRVDVVAGKTPARLMPSCRQREADREEGLSFAGMVREGSPVGPE